MQYYMGEFNLVLPKKAQSEIITDVIHNGHQVFKYIYGVTRKFDYFIIGEESMYEHAYSIVR